MQTLSKHEKYQAAYKPNDYYWGLGVEHEAYLETGKNKQITVDDLKNKRARERYSVSYYDIYNLVNVDAAIDDIFKKSQSIMLPVLMNSHSFQKTDIYGEHETTYERIPKHNPKFSGKTIFNWAKEKCPDYFEKEFDKTVTFDGDTIEFITQNFYKATVGRVIAELSNIETRFINMINSLPDEGLFKMYRPFKICAENYGFASYITNLKNNAMFNNGTMHINVTLPTELDSDGKIADLDNFRLKHQNLARAFQWISPLLVARYGAADPLSQSTVNGDKYAAGSQRIAVSRYIGLGTYDTDIMEPGKILTKSVSELQNIDWYYSIHNTIDYKFLPDIGMDINYNKHYSHGLEFRIFESMSFHDLRAVLNIIVHLCDLSLVKTITNPKKNAIWHKIAEKCVYSGKGAILDADEQNSIFKCCGINIVAKEPELACNVLDMLYKDLSNTFKNGICVTHMIYGNKICNTVPAAHDVNAVPMVLPRKRRFLCF